MKPIVALVLAGIALRLSAADNVPHYELTDTYASAPTMLCRVGIDGAIKEIWSGMDSTRMRHVPLFLESTIFARVNREGKWLDLRTLHYRHEGDHPGMVRLVSDDSTVAIEVTSRRDAALSPIFVRYSFRDPVAVRLSARLKIAGFTRAYQAVDASGYAEYKTLWRGENAVLTSTDGPTLDLATLPAGQTIEIDSGGFLKDIPATKEVVLCIDATGSTLTHPRPGSFVGDWKAELGGYSEDRSSVLAKRVEVTTGDARLDHLFSDSLDAIQSHQFASGDMMADVFFYRDSWLRDGTYTAIGLALAGDHADVDRYFKFWTAQHDFSVGGEREAQQPAIGITGMWFYSHLDSGGEAFLERAWPYVSFYANYYAKRVSREGMLNLAEEWICFIPAPSTWPNSEVYSGLRASAKIARKLGHAAEAQSWDAAAEALKHRFSEIAFDQSKGRLIPMAGPVGASFTDPEYPKAESRNGPLRDDRVDSGMLILPRPEVFGRDQGIIAVDDPRFASTQAQVMRDLENPDHSIFRFGPNPSSPHAPQGELDTWPINTAWAAQDEWLLGRLDTAWRYILSGIVYKRGYDPVSSCDYLPEFWDRSFKPDKQMIVWSHGDFVTSVLLLLTGFDVEPPSGDLGLAPSLPPGTGHASIKRFRFRDWLLDIELSRSGDRIKVDVSDGGQAGGKTLQIRTPGGDLVALGGGKEVSFMVEPGRYPGLFGRSRNAPERARILSRTLLGLPLPKDHREMTQGEADQALHDILAGYVPANK
jgi:hypothetical protein